MSLLLLFNAVAAPTEVDASSEWVIDTFTGSGALTAHTGEFGTWVNHSGTPGSATLDGSGAVWDSAGGITLVEDAIIENSGRIIFDLLGNSAAGIMGVAMPVDASDNAGLACYYIGDTDTLRLVQTGVVETEYFADTMGWASNGAVHTVELWYSGPNVVLYADGVVIFEGGTVNIDGNVIGILGASASATEWRMSRMRAGHLPASATVTATPTVVSTWRAHSGNCAANVSDSITATAGTDATTYFASSPSGLQFLDWNGSDWEIDSSGMLANPAGDFAGFSLWTNSFVDADNFRIEFSVAFGAGAASNDIGASIYMSDVGYTPIGGNAVTLYVEPDGDVSVFLYGNLITSATGSAITSSTIVWENVGGLISCYVDGVPRIEDEVLPQGGCTHRRVELYVDASSDSGVYGTSGVRIGHVDFRTVPAASTASPDVIAYVETSTNYVYDTFTGSGNLSAHEGEFGAVWTVTTGTPTLSSGAVVGTGTTAARTAVTPPSADYFIEADVSATSSSAATIALRGRFDFTASTGYDLEISPTTLNIHRWDTGTRRGPFGSTSAHATYTHGLAEDGTVRRIRVEFEGDTIRGFIDNVLVVHYTDPNPITTAGHVGFRGTSMGQSGTYSMSSFRCAPLFGSHAVTATPDNLLLGSWFRDTFSGDVVPLDEHVSDTGGTWEFINSTTPLAHNIWMGGGRVFSGSSLQGYARVNLAAPSDDYVVTVTTSWTGSTSQNDVLVRYDFDADSGYGIRLTASTINFWRWENGDSPNFTDWLVTKDHGWTNNGATHTIRVEVEGPTIRVYGDGTHFFTITDPDPYATGDVGLYVDGTTTQPTFTSFTWEPLTTAGSTSGVATTDVLDIGAWFRDTFTGTAQPLLEHVSDSGHHYQHLLGELLVDDGEISIEAGSSNTYHGYFVDTTLPSANYEVIGVTGGSGSGSMELRGRFDPSTGTGYAVAASLSGLRLYRYENNSPYEQTTQVALYDPDWDGSDHVFAIRFIGDVVYVINDGEIVITFEDPDPITHVGQVGFWANNVSSAGGGMCNLRELVVLPSVATSVVGDPDIVDVFQHARPIADISVGNWTTQSGATTNLYASIDDSTAPADDTDYIQSEPYPSADVARFQLGPIDTPGPGQVSIFIRYRSG